MKKKKTKNLAAVAIALFGFAIIGTNVSSGIENPYPAPPPGGGGGGTTWYQSMGYCGWGGMTWCCTTEWRASYCTYYECAC